MGFGERPSGWCILYTRDAEAWKSRGWTSLMQGKQPPPGYKTYYDRATKRWVLVSPEGQKHVCEAGESRLDVLELAYNHWRANRDDEDEKQDETDHGKKSPD